MAGTLSFLLSFLLLYKYWTLFTAIFLAAIIVPIPVNPLLLASGAFASQGYMSFSLSLFFVVLANVVGDSIDFFLARKYGRPILQKMRVKIPPYFERLERFVNKYPGGTIFITRFVGTIEPLTSLLCGFIGIKFRKFILYDILGNFVSDGIVLYAGYFLGVHWQDFTGIFNITDYILLIIAIIIAFFIASWRKNKKIKIGPFMLSLMIIFTTTLTTTLVLIQTNSAYASTASINNATVQITPSEIHQGDPIMITLPGIDPANIKNSVVGKSKLSFFDYNNSATALYGIDINHVIGTSTVIIKFTDGSQATTSFFVMNLPKPQEFLAVPDQLGGNSAANQAKTVSILNKENANLATIVSHAKIALWTTDATSTFIFPVASSTESPLAVTDPYGYIRNSGSQTIIHKGTDFQAPVGTPVYAINNGTILATKKYITYGDTVVVDHGLGLLSMYMHLSKMVVSPKQFIKKGQLIGYSGETGYSEGPHLHLTIRIGGVSIDPMKFYGLFDMKI